MRSNLPTPVKAILLILCVCAATHYLIGYLKHHSQRRSNNTPQDITPRKIHSLQPQIAKAAYKVYNASGDQRKDNVKIIQWFPAPNFITTDSFLHQVICGNVRCAVATKGTFLPNSHAVIFPDVYVQESGIPFKKSKNKVWILFNDRPFSSQNITNMMSVLTDRSVFNWTVSFRRDADVKISYGKIINRTAVPRYSVVAILSRKETTVIALQESCKTSSKAEEYIKRLRRYVKVDVWGYCNNSTFCSAADDTRCFTELGRRYKFFLAFEDMFCADYITERFFRYYRTDAVAIVRGGADYTKVVPSGTYINTADFTSVEQLGRYINYLDMNDKEYIEILNRKRHYESVYSHYAVRKMKELLGFRYMNMKNMMCDICHRLWNKDAYTKNYDDIIRWYEKLHCYKPTDIK